MTSLWLIAFTWLRTCESLVDYDWLTISWLTIVTSYDVMTFAHDSYYKSWVSRMRLIWAHYRVYGFGSMERDVRSWLIQVSWWISHYNSLWVIGVMIREVMRHQGYGCGKIPIKGAWFRPRDRLEPSPLHLRRLKSQHHEKSSSRSPPTCLLPRWLLPRSWR